MVFFAFAKEMDWHEIRLDEQPDFFSGLVFYLITQNNSHYTALCKLSKIPIIQ